MLNFEKLNLDPIDLDQIVAKTNYNSSLIKGKCNF